ncbi:PFE-CTERM domain-containing protein [Leptolyngbya sp. AN03gr2]
MKSKTSLLPLGAAGAAIVSLGWATPTHALSVIGNNLFPISNTNTSSINDSNIDPATSLPAPQRKAVGFTTDSRTWAFNFADLGLVGLDASDAPIVELREDSLSNPGNPGTAVVATLGNFNPTPTGGGRNVFRVTSTSGSVVLAPNTTYWLYLAGGAYNWYENGPTDPVTGLPTGPGDLPTALNSSGWAFVNYRFTGNGSLDWGAGNGIRNAFQIDADEITPIPFAFTPIPGLIVSGIIGGLRRARKKAIETVEA